MINTYDQDIADVLLKKLKQKALHHFCILSGGQEQTKEWLSYFINESYQDNKRFSFESNPFIDVLIIRAQGTQFKTVEFEPFFQFLSYNTYEKDHRFIIIDRADCLTSIIINKLLKSLEEPITKTTIFLMNTTSSNLMDTLESRAIKIKLKKEITTDLQETYNPLIEKYIAEQISSLQFLTEAKNQGSQSNFIRFLIQKSDQLKSFDAKQEFLYEVEKAQNELMTGPLTSGRLLGLVHSAMNIDFVNH